MYSGMLLDNLDQPFSAALIPIMTHFGHEVIRPVPVVNPEYVMLISVKPLVADRACNTGGVSEPGTAPVDPWEHGAVIHAVGRILIKPLDHSFKVVDLICTPFALFNNDILMEWHHREFVCFTAAFKILDVGKRQVLEWGCSSLKEFAVRPQTGVHQGQLGGRGDDTHVGGQEVGVGPDPVPVQREGDNGEGAWAAVPRALAEDGAEERGQGGGQEEGGVDGHHGGVGGGCHLRAVSPKS